MNGRELGKAFSDGRQTFGSAILSPSPQWLPMITRSARRSPAPRSCTSTAAPASTISSWRPTVTKPSARLKVVTEPEPPPASHDGAGLTPATRLRPPGLLELEELLAEHLETRVSVQLGAKRGKVTIEFADLEDLERIYRKMTSS